MPCLIACFLAIKRSSVAIEVVCVVESASAMRRCSLIDRQRESDIA